MNFFGTFPECSLPSTVSKNTIKMICHHSRLRDVMAQSYPIYACTRANHAVIRGSTLHFEVARNIVHKSNTREKTWQLESVQHIEQYIKLVETSHFLKRRGRKAFCRVVIFCGHNLHHWVMVLCSLSPISLFPSDKTF